MAAKRVDVRVFHQPDHWPSVEVLHDLDAAERPTDVVSTVREDQRLAGVQVRVYGTPLRRMTVQWALVAAADDYESAHPLSAVGLKRRLDDDAGTRDVPRILVAHRQGHVPGLTLDLVAADAQNERVQVAAVSADAEDLFHPHDKLHVYVTARDATVMDITLGEVSREDDQRVTVMAPAAAAQPAQPRDSRSTSMSPSRAGKRARHDDDSSSSPANQAPRVVSDDEDEQSAPFVSSQEWNRTPPNQARRVVSRDSDESEPLEISVSGEEEEDEDDDMDVEPTRVYHHSQDDVHVVLPGHNPPPRDDNDGIPPTQIVSDSPEQSPVRSMPMRSTPQKDTSPLILGTNMTVNQLRRRFTMKCSHPRDQNIRVDFENGHHDYYVNDVLISSATGWYSASGLGKKLWPEFDAEGISARLAGKGKYVGQTAADIRAQWDLTRDAGSEKHALYDRFLRGEDVDIDLMPRGFFRALYEISEKYNIDIITTEYSIYDEDLKLMGQLDALGKDRVTGENVVIDWKNCADEQLNKGSDTYGNHPFTSDLQSNKFNHYQIQLQIYAAILRRKYTSLGPVASRCIMVNFQPAFSDAYRIYEVTLDIAPLLEYLPWHDDDPRHNRFPGNTVIPYVDDNDPRVMGGTASKGRPEKGKVPDDVIYPFRAYTRNGYCYATESKYKHPWSWFGQHPPRGAYGFYERHLLQSPGLLLDLRSVVGKRVLCWCADGEKCHADVLIKYANLMENNGIDVETLKNTGRLWYVK